MRPRERDQGLEARGNFGPEFIAIARAIRAGNDERARIKGEIDRAMGVEEWAEVKEHRDSESSPR
jgi:hypothetical protein